MTTDAARYATDAQKAALRATGRAAYNAASKISAAAGRAAYAAAEAYDVATLAWAAAARDKAKARAELLAAAEARDKAKAATRDVAVAYRIYVGDVRYSAATWEAQLYYDAAINAAHADAAAAQATLN